MCTQQRSGQNNHNLDKRHDTLAAASIIAKAAVFISLVLSVFSLILALPTAAIWFGAFGRRAVVLSESGLGRGIISWMAK